MSEHKFSKDEQDLLKVMKMNQLESAALKESSDLTIKQMDDAISSSEKLLKELGINLPQKKELNTERITVKKELVDSIKYEDLLQKANSYIQDGIDFEDILTDEEMNNAYNRVEEINSAFSKKTSIINKTDLIFLGIATALQTTKALVYPYIAQKMGYGEKIDKGQRLEHNDKKIKDEQKKANDKFRDKHSDKQKKGERNEWIEILYRPPAFDATAGSKDLGINMEGGFHRVHTLGHDPILGWIFGTANILTDTITFENFQTNKVTRKPLLITPQQISLIELFNSTYKKIQEHELNLPAAIFAEAVHLKSDINTKLGLPIPLLEAIDSNFASELYKSNYDTLCLARDMKFIGVSAAISIFFDMVISLVHGLFNKEKIDKKIYEVRTRKILLISNSIASTSSIINAAITQNPKNLDIGGLLNTVSRCFRDIRFITKVKEEFINNELNKDLQLELNKLDEMIM